MTSLKSLNLIPDKYRSIFYPIREFNTVQSQVFNDVFKRQHHIVVSAPTGSVKTVIFELAILELLMRMEVAQNSAMTFKIVYIAPTKALCNEIFQKWDQKFKPLNLKVALVTGDTTDMDDLNVISPYHIIVTTPEKWDSITRKWNEHSDIANAVRLVLIDEIHLVGDKKRGPTLEAIVSRFKTFRNGKAIRIVAASASLPNIEDFSKWIASQSIETVQTFKLDNSKPSVKVIREVYGYIPTGSSFTFLKQLNSELIEILPNVLGRFGKQILIFCPTRNDVEDTLTELMAKIVLSLDEIQQRGSKSIYVKDELQAVSEGIKDGKLRTFVRRGFAYHHAGLTFEDRESVENAYKMDLIKILVCSQTLACGVNLPAHTVIIKSTEMFIDGRNQEMPESMILQMMGRAGRQEYNTSGYVYIITQKDKVKYYENLSVGTVQIESHLNVDVKLAEFLNAEIALNTITNEKSLVEWLQMTFFYARNTETKAQLKELYEKALSKLQISNLIERKMDGSLLSLSFGAVMAKYFLSISTMDTFQRFKGDETIAEILRKIVECNEFSEHFSRYNEFPDLKQIAGKPEIYRYPSITPVMKSSMFKVSCLLQAVLGHMQIHNSALLVDSQKILQTSERVVQSLVEFFQCHQYRNNCFKATLSATLLAKSLRMRTWNDKNVFIQLGISDADANRLYANQIFDIDDLTDTAPREIEDILEKMIPFGSELVDKACKKFPHYEVNVKKWTEHVIHICVSQTNSQHVYDPTGPTVTLLVGDSNNQIILHEDIQFSPSENSFEKLLHLSRDGTFVYVCVIHNSLAGVDRMETYNCIQKTKSSDDCIAETNALLYSIWTDPMKKTQNQASTARNSKQISVDLSNSVRSNRNPDAVRSTFNNKEPFSKQSNTKKQTIMDHFQVLKHPTLFSDTSKMIEKSKNLTLSPDIFSTQSTATQKPNCLYKFSKEYDQNKMDHDQLFSNNLSSSDVEFNSPTDRQLNAHTQHMVETQIQNKIRQLRDGPNDFVCAKDICRKDLLSKTKEDMIDAGEHSSLDIWEDFDSEDEQERSVLEIWEDFDSEDEKERSVLEIWENFDSDNEKNKTVEESNGLTTLQKETNKNQIDIVRKIINSTTNICNRDLETICYDFEDDQNESLGSCSKTNAKKNAFLNGNNERSMDWQENSPNKMNVTPTPRQFRCREVNNNLPIMTKNLQKNPFVASEDSSSSNIVTLGALKRKQPLPEEPSFSRFQFSPPKKMSKINSQQQSENSSKPSGNKRCSSIADLMKMSAKNTMNAYNKTKNPRDALVNQNVIEPVAKMSLKNTFMQIPLPNNKPELNINHEIEKCRRRRLLDENYTQSEFDMDILRLTVLKIVPPKREIRLNDDDNDSDSDDLTHCSFSDDTFNFSIPDYR